MADHAQKQRGSAKHEGKKPVTTVSEIVEFNEKAVLDNIKDDIHHGVAHTVNELEQHVNDLDDSWETESMLADMLEGLAEDEHASGIVVPYPVFCFCVLIISYKINYRISQTMCKDNHVPLNR